MKPNSVTRRSFFRVLLASGTILATAVGLSACHSQAAKRSMSPIIGTWHISGETPQPGPNRPRFTNLRFERDGNLDVTYVVATGALTGIVKTTPKLAHEQDTFVLRGRTHLRIIEGSRALEYTYDVHDGKLFLRSGSTDESTVYVKVADTDSAESPTTEEATTPTPPAAQQ